MDHTKPTSAALAPSATFIPGAAHRDMIGHYVDCSANPYDLRPAADTIISAAYAMREQMPDDQPLAIVMGEPHGQPAHLALQHLVASRLMADEQKISACFEHINNYWRGMAGYYLHDNIPEGLEHHLYDHDPSGRATLSIFLGYDRFPHSPLSYRNLKAFFYHNDIPTIFGDVARENDGSFNLQDPITARMVQQRTGSNNVKNLSVPDSMAIRNLTIACRSIEHAKNQHSKIIIQQTGTAHVLGWEQAECKYEGSLCAAYRQAGAEVLPVILTQQTLKYHEPFGLNALPEDSYNSLIQSVVIDGIAEDSFAIQSWDTKRTTRTRADKEIRCIEKLHENSGGEIELYDIRTEKKQDRERAQARARQDADAVIARYEASLDIT